MGSMLSLVRIHPCTCRPSTDFSISGEATEESIELVKEIETQGSPNGKTKTEVKVTASGVVEE
jgi:hypothetical protein